MLTVFVKTTPVKGIMFCNKSELKKLFSLTGDLDEQDFKGNDCTWVKVMPKYNSVILVKVAGLFLLPVYIGHWLVSRTDRHYKRTKYVINGTETFYYLSDKK